MTLHDTTRLMVIVRHYCLALAVAAGAGLLGMAVTYNVAHRAWCDPSAPGMCPDGIAYVIPTFTGGLLLAGLALGGCLLVFTRSAGSDFLRDCARAAMWLAVLAACLLWLVPMGLLAAINSGATVTTLLLSVGYALPVVTPLAADRAHRRAVAPALVVCLLAAASVPLLEYLTSRYPQLQLVPIQVVPAAAACGGAWLIALVLWWRAGRVERFAPCDVTPD